MTEIKIKRKSKRFELDLQKSTQKENNLSSKRMWLESYQIKSQPNMDHSVTLFKQN